MQMKTIFFILMFIIFSLISVGAPFGAMSSETKTGKTNVTDVASGTPVTVGDISFAMGKNGGERVCFPFSRPCVPVIFSVPGKKPRIVVDVKEVSEWHGKARIPVNGLLVKQIRVHLHRNTKKLRIVLELDPSMDYNVIPFYYKAERLYCVEVSGK